MKKLLILLVCFSVYTGVFAQTLSDIDEVYPFHGDFAAIKKANQWAFVNKEGKKIIDFRSDLVLTNRLNSLNQTISYPVFNDGRCLIRKLMGDTYYYGFINEKGVEVIKPQFLNATNFSNGYAIVVLTSKDSIGFNYVLKKAVVSNIMEEYVINTSGELVKYLYNPRKNVPANYKNGVPIIESKFIAPNLVAVKTKNKKWEIHQF
ncbi:MAG: WG repeat-containing protein [Lutibacter sp.]|nr:WG repeat-containing protein [Lutibacter sp.]